MGDIPTNLVITKIAANNVKLTWLYNNASGDTITFHIARKVGAGDWDEYYDEVGEDTYEFIDYINTSDNSVYAYKVRYYNKPTKTYSNFSEAVAYFSDFTVPTDLIINQESQSVLTLTWTDNCIGEEGYRIDRKIGNGNWNKKYLELPENTVTVTDNVAIFDTLYYRVYVFSGKSESATTQDSIFQTLSAPSDLSTYILDDNKIRLNWIDNSLNEAGFYIDRKVGGLNWVINYETIADSNETTFVDDILYPCGTLAYRVRAYYDQFTSNYCEADTINVNLNIVGELATYGSALEVCMSDWTAFVADNYEGLAVIDCSNPSFPQLITSYSLPDRTVSSHIVSNFAYVATHSGINTPGVIQKLDITIIEEPVLVDFTNIPGNPKDIFVDGDYAYIAESENGLSIVYIAGSNLYTVANYPMSDARHVYIDGSYAFVADGLNGLKIINVLDPQNPQLLSQVTTSGIINDVHVIGNYAFLADGENGLKILNISNIYYPSIVTTINTGGFVYGVYAEDDYIYIVDKENGFYVIDYSAVYAAFILGHIALDTEPISAYLSGSYVYITDNEGLKIIQVKP